MDCSEKISCKFAVLLSAFLFLGISSCNHGRLPLNLSVLNAPTIAFEPYGPTDISGMAGNGRLSVAVNGRGTITVFKWPNPSYYDHIKYMTSSREEHLFGALENEGAFSGIYYQTDKREGFSWLRDKEWHISQKYYMPESLVLVTCFENPDLKLKVSQYDLVDPELDLLRRHYIIEREPSSPVKSGSLIMYANFNPVVSKITTLPMQDWCLEYLSDSTIEFIPEADAFMQFKKGKDISTGKESSLFLAFGLDTPSDNYQAGRDSIAKKRNRRSRDAFFQAERGQFSGDGFAKGQVNAGIAKKFDFSVKDSFETSLIIAAADSREEALDILEKGRALPFHQALEKTHSYWSELIASSPMPDTSDERITRVARLSLLVLLANFCKDQGAIVASIATQAPYGEDWPRDGAYINEALLKAGFHELVERHNYFYTRHQSSEADPVFYKVPPGNWASNYWSDGTPGFPIIWWEIDETGFAVWTLWRYYEETEDMKYLDKVYPSMKQAADFLTEFRDHETGMTRKAFENDNPKKKQTIHGAVTAYLGLNSACLAAEVMKDDESLARWTARKNELDELILSDFYNRDLERFVNEYQGQGNPGWAEVQILWPVELIPWSDARAEKAAEHAWSELQPSIKLERDYGSYEVLSLLTLAKVWRDDAEKIARVREAIIWEATVPTNELGHFGEIWMKQNGDVVPGESQPHVWHHALFYLAVLEAFGEK